VRAHGGEILCWNNTGDSGSTFVVKLPATSEEANSAAAKEAGR
jgi:signal transduction histidine kinase